MVGLSIVKSRITLRDDGFQSLRLYYVHGVDVRNFAVDPSSKNVICREWRNDGYRGERLQGFKTDSLQAGAVYIQVTKTFGQVEQNRRVMLRKAACIQECRTNSILPSPVDNPGQNFPRF